MGSIVAFLIDIHEISKPYLRTGHYPTGVLDFSVLKNDMEMLLRVKWICAQGKGVSKMPVFLQFIIRRMLLIPVSLFIITLVLYGGVMLTPPEARATIYMQDTNRQLTEEQTQRMLAVIVRNHHLEDPLPIQYAYWIKNLIAGSWGYSPSHTACNCRSITCVVESHPCYCGTYPFFFDPVRSFGVAHWGYIWMAAKWMV